jgi:hypothetical protein
MGENILIEYSNEDDSLFLLDLATQITGNDIEYVNLCKGIHTSDILGALKPIENQIVWLDGPLSRGIKENKIICITSLEAAGAELIEKLNEHQIYDIDIQTNLSTNIQKIVEKLRKRDLRVKFFSSFHNEFADFKSFIGKNNFLVESGYYGGIHYMWTKRFSTLSYNRFKILNSFTSISISPVGLFLFLLSRSITVPVT